MKRAIDLDGQATEEAKENREDDLKYDDAWCVVDVDEHPHLTEALELAKKSGVKVALPRATSRPRTMTLPAVSETSSRTWLWMSHPARSTAGVMSLVQTSRSESGVSDIGEQFTAIDRGLLRR